MEEIIVYPAQENKEECKLVSKYTLGSCVADIRNPPKGGHNLGIPVPPYDRLSFLKRKDIVEFSNYPEDDHSVYILQLISLHLASMTQESKENIISVLKTELNIKPFLTNKL